MEGKLCSGGPLAGVNGSIAQTYITSHIKPYKLNKKYLVNHSMSIPTTCDPTNGMGFSSKNKSKQQLIYNQRG